MFSLKDTDLSLLVRETSNGAFDVSYGESRLTCKFEVNTATLDFGRFKVSNNPIFHSSSSRPQMLSFVLLTMRGD